MPRRSRVHYYGALYHVIVRGNNKEYIFEQDEDKAIYKDIIKNYKKKYYFVIYAYCIMNNHAHILIEIRDTPLSRIMQGIQQVYTQLYNKKYERTGHVFEQRYKAILCDKENYFLELIKYIHQNPIKANITETPDYKWSSYVEYIGRPDIVDVSEVLLRFSENNQEAIKRYQEFMGVLDQQDNNFEYALPEQDIEKQSEIPTALIKIGKDNYLERVTKYYGVSLKEYRTGRLTKELRQKRAIIILLSKEITNISNKELSELFGITPSGITKILTRTDYNVVKDEYDKLKMSICQA
ncbi:transposase [Desulfitibacter alkalitolerans]|uniref:transposase n=1 Tax=Desulfitibacter alkalitolerans TaxID=264641 RepID=UPI0006848B67|nr:transposase [Desulfitibacter alkalitolerans]